MSPVQPRKQRNPRSMVIGVAGLVFGIVLVLAVFVFAIPKLTESGTIEVKLGADKFALGNALVKAPDIDRDGPFLFSDAGSGQHDIYVQHLGADPRQGWSAFDARRPGKGRECPLDWNNTTKVFTDRCDGTTVAADGESLPHFPVEITSEDQILVDLKASSRGTSTTAPGGAPTTDGIIVTK
jgi:hypothetical protein